MWGVIMAKKKPSKLTNLQKEYNQQLRRVKRFYSSFKERGFFLSQKAQEAIDKIISKGFVSSKNKPKISTKTVQSLKNKTPDYFYKNSQYIDLQSGEVTSGERGKWLRNQPEYQKRQRSIGNRPFTKTRITKKFVEKIFSEEPKTTPEEYAKDNDLSEIELTEEEQQQIRDYVNELRQEKKETDIRKKFYSDRDREDTEGSDNNLPK
jgi:Spy/CpxP family protein refolding chaperone